MGWLLDAAQGAASAQPGIAQSRTSSSDRNRVRLNLSPETHAKCTTRGPNGAITSGGSLLLAVLVVLMMSTPIAAQWEEHELAYDHVPQGTLHFDSDELPESRTRTQASDQLPEEPIMLELTEPSTLFEAKYGQRTVWLEPLQTESFEMRLKLWRLLGEPVELYLFRTARLSRLTFEADGGYANRVEIRSTDKEGEDYIRESNYVSETGDGVGLIEIVVSQDVLDRISYYDFTYSLRTPSLDPLPDQYYEGQDDPRRLNVSSPSVWNPTAHFNQVYIHSRVPGILGRTGEWGWDVPGSPDWGEFLSPYATPLGKAEYVLPEDRWMDGDVAKEAFRRMLYRHHVEKRPLFVNTKLEMWVAHPQNQFSIQNLEVSTADILSLIYEYRPETYAKIMERLQVAEKDAEVAALIARTIAAYHAARDDSGIIQTSEDLDQQITSADRTVSGYKGQVSDELRHEWLNLRQRYVDASFERQLAGFGKTLSAVTESTLRNVEDDTRARIARMRKEAEGTASPRIIRRIRSVERLLAERVSRGDKRFRDCEGCPELAVAPSGSFMMGPPSRGDWDFSVFNLIPGGLRHRVTIGEPFAYGVYPVKFVEWNACVRAGKCLGYRPDDREVGQGNEPVSNVSWEDTQAYVKWLSRETGEEYRLLSESEWEYVVRERAVGDVFGEEWTQDCWNDGYRGAPTDGSAWERGDCSRRVVRGASPSGCYPRSGRYARSCRDGGKRGPGFRIARSLSGSDADEARWQEVAATADDDTDTAAISDMFGMFGTGAPAERSAPAGSSVSTVPPTQGRHRRDDDGVTGMLGMFTKEGKNANTVGALAINTVQGSVWGWAYGYATIAEAERRALQDCGDSCRIVRTFLDGCAAYAADQTPGSTVWGGGANFDSGTRARRAALDECAKRGGKDCIVRVWACNDGR